MKRFRFNKPLVESPYPPQDTNALWVDVDESTDDIKDIKAFTPAGIWDTTLINTEDIEYGAFQDKFVLPVLQLNLTQIVKECNNYINNITNKEMDDDSVDGYLWVSTEPINKTLFDEFKRLGSIAVQDTARGWIVSSSDEKQTSDSTYKIFTINGYSLPNHETVSQYPYDQTTGYVYTDTVDDKILICNILNQRLGYYQPFTNCVDLDFMLEHYPSVMNRPKHLMNLKDKIHSNYVVLCEIGYLISIAPTTNITLETPLLCLKFKKIQK